MTRTGFPRSRNEDHFVISPEKDFYTVADGIGGASYGAVMSKVACLGALEGWISQSGGGAAPAERLRRAVLRAHNECRDTARRLVCNCGAAMVAVNCDKDIVRVASIGDCAVFLASGGTLVRLNRLGRVSRHCKQLTGAVGSRCRARIDYHEERIVPGDRLLLCSDGVWESVDEMQMLSIVSDSDAERAAANLVAAADGNDDATAVVVIPGCR